ncbi:response regulator [Aurantimonas sp. DM33-3]|uniref:response regulator n=1 Tax=Aurantimonas sp. DM33-3 TaxID=2766955 RepID=UPI00165261AD|nr:response regulator [Aurantimonas sp. DM33-3]MBC6716051.1 response regulator [Aurantimonas sp. DM33-3]
MQAQPHNTARYVAGLKVFVVEDESLVAMQLEDMLFDLGCEVVGLAMRLKRAHDMLDSGMTIDVAILDVNIGGEKIYPVATRLREAGIPIVFATGYGREGLETEWQVCPVLQKPYSASQIEHSILTVTD